MDATYQVKIDVTVHDQEELRSFAFSRAKAAGITKREFEHYESSEHCDKCAYYLTWAFDNGTPDFCGFSIDNSETISTEQFAAQS